MLDWENVGAMKYLKANSQGFRGGADETHKSVEEYYLVRYNAV
jgi:hypothetical protein